MASGDQPITVMGAGVFGLSIAFELARRGARGVVVDPRGVGAGASGGIVGALAPHVPENWNDKKAFQFDSLILAAPFWAGVAEISGQDPGYARLGRVQPVLDARGLALAQARADQARTLWQGQADWRVVPARDCGWSVPEGCEHVIHDTLSARVHPRRAVFALAAALARLGWPVVPDPAPGAGGTVVWATGYEGLGALTRTLGRPAGTGVKGQALLLAHDRRDRPQYFADGVHFIPHADGTLAVGSTSEREFDDPHCVDAQLDALHGRAVDLCAALAGARVLERWAGVRPRAASRAPLLGPYPGRGGAYIANGGFKIGFGMAPNVARVMADLVLDGRDRIPPAFHTDTLGA